MRLRGQSLDRFQTFLEPLAKGTFTRLLITVLKNLQYSYHRKNPKVIKHFRRKLNIPNTFRLFLNMSISLQC
jgi:hypothetical protein